MSHDSINFHSSHLNLLNFPYKYLRSDMPKEMRRKEQKQKMEDINFHIKYLL